MSNSIWSQRLYETAEHYREQGAFDTAAHCFQASRIAEPSRAEAWREEALMHLKIGELPKALYCIRHAIELNPNSPRILTIAAMIETDRGCFEQASHWIKQAQQLDPDNPGIDLAEAEIYRLSGHHNQAEQALQKAADKGVEIQEIDLRRCELLRAQNKFDALSITLSNLLANHQEPRIQLMLGEQQLAQENYVEGWNNYEARLYMEEQPLFRNYPWPYWKGEHLENKTILVYGEQGVGDEILFSSCLPDLIKLAKNVIIILQERLSDLLIYSFSNLKSLTHAEALLIAENHPTSIDYCIAVGSLPLHFRNKSSDFPKHNGYLKVADIWLHPWREKLRTLNKGLKVGISWQGGVMSTGLLNRSLNREQLLPLLELPGIQFINIQHGKVRRELEWLAEKRNLPVTTWPLDTKNITELAGLVSALDLIITPCCSLVHLAGALGKPVWVMTPKVAAWRYLNEGETMPWYPSARLFRQPEAGDWASVIESVRQQLLAQ